MRASSVALEEGLLSLPDLGRGVYVPRLLQVDLLRGAWFVRTEWLSLLLREATPVERRADLEAVLKIVL